MRCIYCGKKVNGKTHGKICGACASKKKYVRKLVALCRVIREELKLG